MASGFGYHFQLVALHQFFQGTGTTGPFLVCVARSSVEGGLLVAKQPPLQTHCWQPFSLFSLSPPQPLLRVGWAVSGLDLALAHPSKGESQVSTCIERFYQAQC